MAVVITTALNVSPISTLRDSIFIATLLILSAPRSNRSS
jgi:hypothetical protein